MYLLKITPRTPIPLLKTRQQNGPKLEILKTAINTCLIIIILSLWLIWKKKKIRHNKNYTGRQVLERNSNWNGVQNTNLHLAYLRNLAEIKSMPSRLIRAVTSLRLWRHTHTWGNGTVPIAVATVFGGFLTFIWSCYLIYATMTSNNDGDQRKIVIPFMTNHDCNCTVS